LKRYRPSSMRLSPHQDQDRPGWDYEVVRRVRERFGDIRLMSDANSAYTLATSNCSNGWMSLA
jgi:L-alanine-DL-glutamate epimerase-like enolase superfamily enzyme